ncbi:MAG: 50S ribosomal protein L3 [Chloroflexi bacterium]|nr:50S ribosomal protein L3 [Chloroflexota bacterium]
MSVTGLLGKKMGAGQLFLADGRVVPVTALQAGPCMVTQVRTKDRDGYEAVQLGFEETKRLNKPAKGHLKAVGKDLRHLREFAAKDINDIQPGQQVTVALFKPGDQVDVSGVSKGRGFQGGVKRHHFKGGPKTHGQSDRQRAPGAIGSTTTPGRVLRGLRMAGHMGVDTVTLKNLEIVAVNQDKHILLVKGAVPGYNGALVAIKFAKQPKSRRLAMAASKAGAAKGGKGEAKVGKEKK